MRTWLTHRAQDVASEHSLHVVCLAVVHGGALRDKEKKGRDGSAGDVELAGGECKEGVAEKKMRKTNDSISTDLCKLQVADCVIGRGSSGSPLLAGHSHRLLL